MGLLSGLIGGFAQGGLTVAQEQIKADTRQKEIEMQNDLEAKRQQMLLQLQDQYKQADEVRANALKNQPLNDYAAAVGARQNDTVPYAGPAPVTSVSGLINREGMTGADGQPIGNDTALFNGDISTVRKSILTNAGMSDDEKQTALTQLQAQADQANKINQAMAPPTRAVSSSEAADMGMQDLLKSGNGAAYAAGMGMATSDAKIAYMQDRLTTLQDRYNDQRTTASEKNVIQQQLADTKKALDESIAKLNDAKASKSGDASSAKESTTLLAAERGNQISLKGEMTSLDNELANINAKVNGQPNPAYAANRAAKAKLAGQLASSRALTTALSNRIAQSLGISLDAVDVATDPSTPAIAPPNRPPLSAFQK